MELTPRFVRNYVIDKYIEFMQNKKLFIPKKC